MQNSWTYRPKRDHTGHPLHGHYLILANGKEAGWVMWISQQDSACHQWRAVDGQHGFVRIGTVADAAGRIRDALTLTPDQQGRNWHDKAPQP